MPVIECQACGHALQLPGSFPEGRPFACEHCGMVLLNVPAARAFRWMDQDPFVRRHGASRWNLWGGIAGAMLWLPIVGAVLVLQAGVGSGLILAMALPYVALGAVLLRRRARRPAMTWLMEVFAGLGLYFCYLWLLLEEVPRWSARIRQANPEAYGVGSLGLMGAIWILAGVAGLAMSRRRAARLPRFGGPPPRE